MMDSSLPLPMPPAHFRCQTLHPPGSWKEEPVGPQTTWDVYSAGVKNEPCYFSPEDHFHQYPDQYKYVYCWLIFKIYRSHISSTVVLIWPCGAVSQITRHHELYDLGTHLQATSLYFYKPLWVWSPLGMFCFSSSKMFGLSISFIHFKITEVLQKRIITCGFHYQYLLY